jgi:6-pyruvoyltetrahydropterin/6-carboxytetrahydropterin synthase
LHGHNWKVEAVAASAALDQSGMVMDFKKLKAALNAVLEKMDHKYLNRLKPFDKVNPTSENIAQYLYRQLKPGVRGLRAVTVWENPASCATYEE